MQILARMPKQEADPDRRRVLRQHAGADQAGKLAGALAGSGASRAPRIFDISRFGCQIEKGGLSDGANGQFVEIDFGGTLVTRAIIRWADHARLGLEFTRPLGSAQVEALLADPAPIRLRRL
jgi:hypothetical protein